MRKWKVPTLSILGTSWEGSRKGMEMKFRHEETMGA
jgi:hypothetical protein